MLELAGYFIVGIFVFYIYILIASAVARNFSQARGFSKVFWFFILLGTFSFLFGGDDDNSDDDSDDNFYGEYDDDTCSYFDNENEFDSCYDDDWFLFFWYNLSNKR